MGGAVGCVLWEVICGRVYEKGSWRRCTWLDVEYLKGGMRSE